MFAHHIAGLPVEEILLAAARRRDPADRPDRLGDPGPGQTRAPQASRSPDLPDAVPDASPEVP